MLDRKLKIRRLIIGLALVVCAVFVLQFPTSRIYLAGAQITHLKSGEWVIAGPNTRLTDARLARVVAAINDRGDISCMRIARPNVSTHGYAPVAGTSHPALAVYRRFCDER